jgi:hypothetical protein
MQKVIDLDRVCLISMADDLRQASSPPSPLDRHSGHLLPPTSTPYPNVPWERSIDIRVGV